MLLQLVSGTKSACKKIGIKWSRGMFAKSSGILSLVYLGVRKMSGLDLGSGSQIHTQEPNPVNFFEGNF